MQVEERTVDGVAIVTVAGDISTATGSELVLNDKIRSLLHQGRNHILIDLGGVAYVDSSGLGRLVQAFVTTRNRGGALKLLNVTKRVRDLLVITRLLTVFDTFEDEAAAVASFRDARP